MDTDLLPLEDREGESDTDGVIIPYQEDVPVTFRRNKKLMIVEGTVPDDSTSLDKEEENSVVSVASSVKTTFGGTHITYIQNQSETLTASTKFVLKEQKRKRFAKTKQFSSALKYIRGSKKLIILSNCGEGRTSLGLELLIELSGVESDEHCKKEPLILRRACEWRLAVNPSEDTVVFLDDVFGRMVLNGKHYKEWETILPDVQAAIDDVDSCLFLIIAMNKYIFYQINRRLQRFKLFSEMKRYTVGLSLYDSEDKKLILTEIVPDIKKSDLDEILDIQNPMAFPLCCSSFVSNPLFLKQGCEFFKNPTEILYTELCTLCEEDKFAFMLLSIILFSEADIYVNNIFCKDTMPPLMEQLANLCFVEKIEYTSLLGRLEIKVQRLNNVLIDYTGEKLNFISNAIESSLIKVFGTMHKRFLINVLHLKLLVEHITADEANEKKVFVDTHYHENLSKRFIQDLERMTSVSKINQCITTIAQSEMIESDMFRSIFVSDFVRMRNFKEIIQYKEDCKSVNMMSTLFQNKQRNSHMFVKEILLQRTSINNQGCCGLKSDWFTREFRRSVRFAIKLNDVKACEVFSQFYDLPSPLNCRIREMTRMNRATVYSMNSKDTAL